MNLVLYGHTPTWKEASIFESPEKQLHRVGDHSLPQDLPGIAMLHPTMLNYSQDEQNESKKRT